MKNYLLRWKWLGILLLAATLAMILPGTVRGEGSAGQDEALLLMFACQSRIYADDYQQVRLHLPGAASVSLDFARQGASPGQINEKKMLADVYLRWSNQLPSSNPASDYFKGKADDYQDQADELAKARRRYLRNQNNIFGRVRRLGRAIADPLLQVGKAVFRGGRWVLRGMGDVGRVVVIIARDEVIIRAKEIIRAKVQDLVDIGRGKLDAVIARIASKAGWPVAELFRQIVLDPAFKRLDAVVQRNIDQVLGQRAAASRAGNQGTDDPGPGGEHETDWDSVNEEGDTDYDSNEVDSVETPTALPEEQGGDGEGEDSPGDDEENPFELTPEELANQGKHSYVCGDERTEEVTYTFTRSSVSQLYHWTHPLERTFSKIDANLYQHDDLLLEFTSSGYELSTGLICIVQ